MATTDDTSHQPLITPAVMIRRALFLVMLLSLGIFYLFIDFRGLSDANGMDQAQIAREVARGNGFVTKAIRPVSLWQTNQHRLDQQEETVPLAGFLDTYHAPLNPLFNAVILSLFKGSWEYDPLKSIYFLDMVIAGASIVLLLCSIGISYLLIARIFDARIAGVTAFLLLLCELLWKFSQTGLPQMLMLFLFSFALYFLYKAVENTQQEKSPYLWAALAGGFFGLLALAHWITIWIFVGALIFSALYFRPRGLVALVLFGVFALPVSIWVVRNVDVTGDPAGSAKYVFYAGLSSGAESAVMRNADPENNQFVLDGFFVKTINTSLRQLDSLYVFLGSVVVAPLFFLSLLHAFRRREIADFRWCILVMWVFATLGMSLFGVTDGILDSNQIHILFVPIMTAYGLAFLSILWNRLDLPMHIPVVRDGHLIIAIIISALPLVLTLPTNVKRGMYLKDRKMNYPPYAPPLTHALKDLVKEHEIVVSDQPWAVAWYADRISLWLPKTVEQFDNLRTYSENRNQPFKGVLLSPISTNQPLARGIIAGEYSEWSPLIVQSAFHDARERRGSSFEQFPFPQPNALAGSEMVFYSERTGTDE
ncbi:hypothetical protein BH23VER1_BH23VER1_28720 [soil metagenome]